MTKKISRGIRIIVLLMFLSILLLLPQYPNPHFILSGIFFIEGIEASLIVSLIISAVILIGFFVFKGYRKSYYPLIFLYAFLGINGIINIIFSYIFTKDLSGFFLRLFNDSGFLGAFIIDQSAQALVSVLIIIYAWSNKPSFSRISNRDRIWND